MRIGNPSNYRGTNRPPSSHSSFSVWRIPRGILVRTMRVSGPAWQMHAVVVGIAFSVWRIPRGNALVRTMRVPGRAWQMHGVVVCVAFAEGRISRRNALVRGLRNRAYGKHRCKRRSQKKLLHNHLRGISLAQDRAMHAESAFLPLFKPIYPSDLLRFISMPAASNATPTYRSAASRKGDVRF